MKCIFGSLAAIEYIAVTKALPGRTTFVVWWRVPTSNRICCFVAFLCSHVVKSCLILATLSTGGLSSMHSVSNIIIRKYNEIQRTSNFSAVRGTPNLLYEDIKC